MENISLITCKPKVTYTNDSSLGINKEAKIGKLVKQNISSLQNNKYRAHRASAMEYNRSDLCIDINILNHDKDQPSELNL